MSEVALPGWAGEISRIKAEEILDQGQYVIRKADAVAARSVQLLSLANHLAMQPYCLTIKRMNGDIVERLIIETLHGWVIYQDEPCFVNYRYYKNVSELIRNVLLIG